MSNLIGNVLKFKDIKDIEILEHNHIHKDKDNHTHTLENFIKKLDIILNTSKLNEIDKKIKVIKDTIVNYQDLLRALQIHYDNLIMGISLL